MWLCGSIPEGFNHCGYKKTINQGHSTHYCSLLLRERRCTTLLYYLLFYLQDLLSSFLYLSLFRTDLSCLFNVFNVLISLLQFILSWGFFHVCYLELRYFAWHGIVWDDNTDSWSLILEETGSDVRRGGVDDMLKLMVAVALSVICASFFFFFF